MKRFALLVAITVISISAVCGLAQENEGTSVQGEYPAAQQAETLTMETILTLFDAGKLGDMDYALYENMEREELPYALNDYIHLSVSYQGEEYRVDVSYIADENEEEYIDAIYLTRLSDKEMCLIYTADEHLHAVYDLKSWLNTKIQISDWFTLELPEGYTLSQYDATIGNAGGALIEPQVYKVLGEDAAEQTPPAWTMSGSVGIIVDAQECFTFEDGQIADVLMMDNHTSQEKIGTLTDLAMPAALYHVSHDLYTAPELEELESQGVDMTQIDTTSEYWYIFFAREHADDAYYIALDEGQFEQEDAIEIARTVQFSERLK